MSEADRNPRHAAHLKFVSRIYMMRTLGLGTGCLGVGGVLHGDGAAWPWLALVAFNGYVWPTVAYRLARRNPNPRDTERRNLMVDSAAGGLWIAVMQLNLLPSLLLAVMLSADKVGVGGWSFLARNAAVQLAAFLLAWTALGFPFRPDTAMADILWFVPFVLTYPLALSSAAYALGRTVARQNRTLARLSRIDVLTGLPNRGQWDEVVASELARGARSGRNAVLLMLDVDHFKQINDHYGHLVGDRVLKAVADTLRGAVREIDTTCRFGGDEFGVVLVETSYADALDVAERIRIAVQALRFADVPDLRCAISIGIAIAGPEMESAGDWVRCADLALYDAKHAGRNQVVAHDLGNRAAASLLSD